MLGYCIGQPMIWNLIKRAPNRIVAHDPWVLDGIRELVAWRAVAHAGLADEGQVERDFAADYAAALGTGDSESLEESEPGEGGGGQIAAPLALVLLERAMVDAGRPGSAAAQPRGRGAGTPAGEDDRRSPDKARATRVRLRFRATTRRPLPSSNSDAGSGTSVSEITVMKSGCKQFGLSGEQPPKVTDGGSTPVKISAPVSDNGVSPGPPSTSD